MHCASCLGFSKKNNQITETISLAAIGSGLKIQELLSVEIIEPSFLHAALLDACGSL